MIISVSNLGKRFNREWIFKGLSAEFTEGNVYAIVGPNGSGKSTLMRVVWGQEPQSEGSIQYRLDGAKLDIEQVFTHLSIAAPYMELIEDFTLAELIDFHFKFKRPIDNHNRLSIMKKLDLEPSADKLIRQFSSGMKQRLRLGLAFFSTCKVLFLDEPTTNLDENAIEWYFHNLREIQPKRLIFIATNQTSDLPNNAKLLDLSTLKPVTRQTAKGIQAI